MVTETRPADGSPKTSDSIRLVRRVTWIGLCVNLFLTALKFFAGVLAHSQVLIADAVHSLSDMATDLAVLIGSRFWGQPADEDHPNGHAKIESLVTLFIGLTLFLVALELIRGAVHSLNGVIDGKRIPLPGKFALYAAVISIILKEWLYRITVRAGRKAESPAAMANAWHHRSDALSSLPAAAAVGICLAFGERYAYLDPVGTILVSCMILFASFEIVRPAISTLLDRGETRDKISQIREVVTGFPEIAGLHKIRTRPLGANRFAVDLHLQVDPAMTVLSAHTLSHRVADAMREKIPDLVDVVAHIEPRDAQTRFHS